MQWEATLQALAYPSLGWHGGGCHWHQGHADAVARPAAAEIPAPAAILALLLGIWDQHHAHDPAALHAPRCKGDASYGAAESAKERSWERIKAMQDMILTGQPASLADAAAILLMAHSEIEIWNDDGGSERAQNVIEALLGRALLAVSFVAQASGMDLAVAGKNYLTEVQARIIGAEVVA